MGLVPFGHLYSQPHEQGILFSVVPVTVVVVLACRRIRPLALDRTRTQGLFSR
jgi:hypothetical protein